MTGRRHFFLLITNRSDTLLTEKRLFCRLRVHLFALNWTKKIPIKRRVLAATIGPRGSDSPASRNLISNDERRCSSLQRITSALSKRSGVPQCALHRSTFVSRTTRCRFRFYCRNRHPIDIRTIHHYVKLRTNLQFARTQIVRRPLALPYWTVSKREFMSSPFRTMNHALPEAKPMIDPSHISCLQINA